MRTWGVSQISRILFIFAGLMLLCGAAWASSTQVIYNFGGDADGEYVDTDLVLDSAGNIYGTSVQGGTFSSGTVFQLTPSGVHTVLYNFTSGADGAQPYKGVTLDAAGNLYGTAVTGGGGSCEGGCGVVYKLTNSGGTWTETVIHAFTGGTDGSGPGSGLAIDAAGNLYGTTPIGGSFGFGVVYQMVPNGDGTWSFNVLHEFTGGNDGGGGGAGRMIFDSAGNLYGVNTEGGANGAGTVFELRQNSGHWQLKTLYTFLGGASGSFPYGGLLMDRTGNLYGTTYYGGQSFIGLVYKLEQHNGQWRLAPNPYSFVGGRDGASPISNLVFDNLGNLYGTTSEGGSATCGGCGTIFKLTPSVGGGWIEKVVYRFPGTPGPGFVYNGMIADPSGTFFYGATVHGGPTDDGTIYTFTP